MQVKLLQMTVLGMLRLCAILESAENTEDGFSNGPTMAELKFWAPIATKKDSEVEEDIIPFSDFFNCQRTSEQLLLFSPGKGVIGLLE